MAMSVEEAKIVRPGQNVVFHTCNLDAIVSSKREKINREKDLKDSGFKNNHQYTVVDKQYVEGDNHVIFSIELKGEVRTRSYCLFDVVKEAVEEAVAEVR